MHGGQVLRRHACHAQGVQLRYAGAGAADHGGQHSGHRIGQLLQLGHAVHGGCGFDVNCRAQ